MRATVKVKVHVEATPGYIDLCISDIYNHFNVNQGDKASIAKLEIMKHEIAVGKKEYSTIQVKRAIKTAYNREMKK